jgi:phosphoribosyl-AMP cyclohydrolase
MSLDALKWDDRGLITAVVQDAGTKQVLMVAWMNAEALRLTQETGETHFWSRSRGEIWHKGATSGNTQRVVSIAADCDAMLIPLRDAQDETRAGLNLAGFRHGAPKRWDVGALTFSGARMTFEEVGVPAVYRGGGARMGWDA